MMTNKMNIYMANSRDSKCESGII